jgi:hypothetical protein
VVIVKNSTQPNATNAETTITILRGLATIGRALST